ncbi:hypothetical protein EVAR_43233_1 [Eumeta japonica]|uniref:Uncharacterized protein n=1 Tax=Eumeta variegata TaxID=151549 RepID=A0A4C1WS44_EUMVA|nr:hypothetical protein EVAR_43233_1 [Eumeta japonica]
MRIAAYVKCCHRNSSQLQHFTRTATGRRRRLTNESVKRRRRSSDKLNTVTIIISAATRPIRASRARPTSPARRLWRDGYRAPAGRDHDFTARDLRSNSRRRRSRFSIDAVVK